MNNMWLVLDGNKVVNIVLWDGVSDWGPGEGLTVEPFNENAAIGSIKNEDGTFTGPRLEIAE